nr:integrase, catalytic region, zinc finger, CCHC-type, peptidase aspartic, catalytic [Tanacetum cinerariifolium]
VERRNQTLMEAARTMLIFAKALLFLWAKAVATSCYTLNRSLVHMLHGKTFYELLKGKKPNVSYFKVFGSLCYPTNDYDDVGKLKAKADIELEISALQSGRTRSELVNEPSPPSVPPTKAQLSKLFYPFFADDDEVALTSNVHPEDAPAITDESQTPPPDTSVVNEENLDDVDDGNIFEPYVADEEASSFNTADVNITYNSPLPHVQTWTKDHPLENVIGELNR